MAKYNLYLDGDCINSSESLEEIQEHAKEIQNFWDYSANEINGSIFLNKL